MKRTVDEVIPFRRPTSGRIIVSNLEPRVTQLDIEESFGTLGLIHNIIMYKTDGKSLYALVTYYSENCARAAHLKRDGVFLRGRPVEVKRVKTKFTWGGKDPTLRSEEVSTRFMLLGAAFSLNQTQLIQLANNLLGFEGWSCGIVRLEPFQGNDPGLEPAMAACAKPATTAAQHTCEWICEVVVTLKDGRTCNGTGVGMGLGKNKGSAMTVRFPPSQCTSLTTLSLDSLQRSSQSPKRERPPWASWKWCS
jgi:hypothetical protein